MKKKIDLPSLFWRDVKGYEGLYQVSIDGEVKSLKWGKERILKPAKNSKGYLLVCLSKDGKSKNYRVHRLVATAFIPNDDPEHKTQINHINEDKTDNRVENLEWCSQTYNNNYGTRNERDAKTKSKPVVGINPVTGNIVVEFSSTMEAERNGGYDHSAVSKCCSGDKGCETYKGLIWCFKGTSDEEINRRITEYRFSWYRRPVVALDKQGRIVHVFPSTMEAERNGGYDHSSISKCCRGNKGYKTAYGLIWKYQDDVVKK